MVGPASAVAAHVLVALPVLQYVDGVLCPCPLSSAVLAPPMPQQLRSLVQVWQMLRWLHHRYVRPRNPCTSTTRGLFSTGNY